MNPYQNNGLQIPTYTSDGYLVTNSAGEVVCLTPGGNYSGFDFSEVDFSFITIRADFSQASFNHCFFNMTDVSGSDFTAATLHDCFIASSAFMWTNSCNLTITQSFLSDVRFAFSNLKAANIEANIDDTNFRDVNLSGANFLKSKISNCEFTDATCLEMSISNSSLENVEFANSDMRWLNLEDSTADYLTFSHCNLAGSTLKSVFSTNGYWRFNSTDLTTARFSMCHAEHSRWNHTTLFGVVMERCNWFKGKMNLCVIEHSTFASVGWNETIFTDVQLQNVDANALRLRFSQFKNCLMIDSTIANSSWEFCQFHATETEDLTILNPAHVESTKWHSGYKPTNAPHPAPNQMSDEESE
jgi:uncharacterized protein YjbI with pentapeptide repeats